MARYLNRACPRCAGYLGIVLRESDMPVRAVNGSCVDCGYRLAWIVISGRRGQNGRAATADGEEKCG